VEVKALYFQSDSTWGEKCKTPCNHKDPLKKHYRDVPRDDNNPPNLGRCRKYDALLTQIAAAAGVEIGNIGPEPKDFVVM
jgi:hypothetical protein